MMAIASFCKLLLWGDRIRFARGPTSRRQRRWRRRLVQGVILFVIIGSAFDIVTRRDNWPFSDYAMYSTAPSHRGVTVWRLYGITARRPENLISLLESKYLVPFDRSRLAAVMMELNGRPDGGASVRAALADCFRRYEARRQRHEHDGPAIIGVGLYELTWPYEARAANVDNPDERRLIAQYVTGQDRGVMP